jgi:hypothetical protein
MLIEIADETRTGQTPLARISSEHRRRYPRKGAFLNLLQDQLIHSIHKAAAGKFGPRLRQRKC